MIIIISHETYNNAPSILNISSFRAESTIKSNIGQRVGKTFSTTIRERVRRRQECCHAIEQQQKETLQKWRVGVDCTGRVQNNKTQEAHANSSQVVPSCHQHIKTTRAATQEPITPEPMPRRNNNLPRQRSLHNIIGVHLLSAASPARRPGSLVHHLLNTAAYTEARARETYGNKHKLVITYTRINRTI